MSLDQYYVKVIIPLTRVEAYTLLRKYSEGALSEALIEKLELPENIAIHEFLTNPFLTSLLFKSFEYKHVIPLKRHIFYRQVYEALFETHDLTKEGGEFQRPKRSGLDIDRFEQVLRAFGAIAYKEGKVEFSKDEALNILDRARTLAAEKKSAPSDILHDLTHAVPLLVEDGNYIRWSHRSIQEYYAAQYISRTTAEKQNKILLDYYLAPDATKHINLLLLCADINRAAFDQSIGKAIAIELLTDYEKIYRKEIPGISSVAIEERRTLTAGRRNFLVNVPDRTKRTSSNGITEDFNRQVSKFLKAWGAELGISSGGTLTNGVPGLGRLTSKLSQFVDLTAERILLPFVQPVNYNRHPPQNFIGAGVELHRLTDDPLNTLNAPGVFEKVNSLLACHSRWCFNVNLARVYLKQLDAEVRERDALEPW